MNDCRNNAEKKAAGGGFLLCTGRTDVNYAHRRLSCRRRPVDRCGWRAARAPPIYCAVSPPVLKSLYPPPLHVLLACSFQYTNPAYSSGVIPRSEMFTLSPSYLAVTLPRIYAPLASPFPSQAAGQPSLFQCLNTPVLSGSPLPAGQQLVNTCIISSVWFA